VIDGANEYVLQWAILPVRLTKAHDFMLLPTLRQAVLEANLELVRRGLVLYTFGNASGISREEGLVAIKPSGVPYETMSAADIVVTDLNGRVMEGTLRPSSDLATHLEIYSPLSGRRRRGPHPFRVCHRLGAGPAADSVFWNDSCGLF